MKEKNRKRFWVSFFICTVIILVILIPLLFVCHNYVFVIKDISAEGETQYSYDDIIAASGIVSGTPMYSIDKPKIKENIMRKYPYIGKVTIKRNLPSEIKITVSESTAKCYTYFENEYFALSDDLRVLEYTTDENKAKTFSDLCVKLPKMSYAIMGEYVEFFNEEKNEYIITVLKELSESVMREKIHTVSVENKFNIYMIYDDIYKITIGSSKDVSLKLMTAKAIIDSGKLEAGTKAIIDVSDPSEGSVITDKNLDLS